MSAHQLLSTAGGAMFALAFSVATAALSDAQSLPTPSPGTMEAVHAAHDWQYGVGEKLEARYHRSVSEMFAHRIRADVIDALNASGYDCIYGEAHPDYPEPAAQCTRSFATRACQMDWEVFVTADKGRVDEITGSFVRDCVGDDRDWPTPLYSPIDDQLAPAPDF